jgi:hypothetical protein
MNPGAPRDLTVATPNDWWTVAALGSYYHSRETGDVRADRRGKQVIVLWTVGLALVAGGFAAMVYATLLNLVISPLVWAPIAAGVPFLIASQIINRGRPTIWRVLRSKGQN